jgi:sec-independent protein translocase protein TatB
MRTAGRWIGKVRRVSAHFRTGIDAMVREAELEDMEKQWKARNEEIMRQSAATAEKEAGVPVMTGPPPIAPPAGGDEAGKAAEPAPEPVSTPPAPQPASQPASSGAEPPKE